MDLLYLGRVAFKATLENNADADTLDYRTALAWPGVTPTVYRTFGAQVHASVPLPYVTIEHYMGGREFDAKSEASDSLWKICAHTEDDEALALTLSSAIHKALSKKWPVMGSVTDYAGYAPIELKFPYIDTYSRQNYIFYKAGGIYRLRLAEIQQG
jgi:hypothetical protein